MKRTIFLIPHNHFDPTWRRCFKRNSVYNGVTVRSYAEVEAHCINAWLALAERGYTFSEGQTVVLRTYLERYPEQKSELQRLARAGLLDVLLAGETVQDSNMSTAEGLVRNFLVAWPFYRDFVGEGHPALKIASCEDVFGNSPNYPQVLKGVGAEVAGWISYRPCPEDIWVGIDGTKMPTLDRHPAGFTGGFAKHPPCPNCQGAGCADCAESGLLFVDGFDLKELDKCIVDALAMNHDSDWVAIRFLTEEILPDVRIIDFIAEWNRTHDDSTIEFGNQMTIYQRHKPTLDAALAVRNEQPTVSLQPAMPGCMVTRIQTKQRTRSIAYHLLAAEAALASESWQAGVTSTPPGDMNEAWQLVAFNQFHDAITGTHLDAANTELMDMLDRAEEIASAQLPLCIAPPAFGHFTPASHEAQTRQFGALEVTFDLQGIISITREGRDLFGEFAEPWNNRQRRARIAELILEPDFGDAWGKRIDVPAVGKIDFYNVLLGKYHTDLEISDTAVRWKGRYTGGDRKVKRLEWTVTARISEDGQRLEFTTDVDWDTESRRLRVLTPVKSSDATAIYEVPFGFCAHTFDAAKVNFSVWDSDTQEFPALHWVQVPIDAQSGVVLLNKGLPCNRWTPGMLDLSLLRSPEFAFCVVEPGSYEFWDNDGQRDTGKHRFEYALYPYTAPLPMGELVRLGYRYNLPAPLTPPFRVDGDVVVTAWKVAEDGKGWILRLQEAGGVGTQVKVTFDSPRQVSRCNLLEQSESDSQQGNCYQTPLHKHGILTLRIR